MNTAALIVIALIASASYFGVMWLVRAYSRYRGTKIVTFLIFDWKTAGAGHWKNSADRSASRIWT